MHDTGGRVSEVRALTPRQIDFNAQAIIFETLKKRKTKEVGLDRFCYYLDNVLLTYDFYSRIASQVNGYFIPTTGFRFS